MLRLADAARAEPIIISQLVRCAQLALAMQPIKEGLAAHQWSDPQLRRMEEGLRHFDFCADAQRTLRAERGFFAPGNIQYVSHHRALCGEILEMQNGSQHAGFNLIGLLMDAAPNGWFYLEEVNQSRMSQEWLLPVIDVPGHRISPAASVAGCERIGAAIAHPLIVLFFQHKLFAAMLIPSCSNLAEKTAYTQAAADTAAIACALERYRLANGHYPESLDSLVPQAHQPLAARHHQWPAIEISPHSRRPVRALLGGLERKGRRRGGRSNRERREGRSAQRRLGVAELVRGGRKQTANPEASGVRFNICNISLALLLKGVYE